MAKKSKLVVPKEEPMQKGKSKNQKTKSISTSTTPEPTVSKPQRGLAIGDNFGWTGKLPATLLFEHAQKQKWNKVIIDMRKTAKGFIGVVNLLWDNPKTRETINLKWQPDTELLQPRETTNEARHFAATYAMYRLNYVKNLKMVLPNLFRNYWSDMETRRLEVLKRDKKYHDEIYNANPFQVYLDGITARESKEREKRAKENSEAKVKKPTATVRLGDSVPSKTQQKSSIKKPSFLNRSFPITKKSWENAPFVDFSPENRISIENSIRSHISWLENESPDNSDKRNWHEQLSELGFRPSHADEALKHTNTFMDALEWLLFYVPEDDLPIFFSRKEEDKSLSLKISTDIKTEYMIQRLSLSGYDKDEIVSQLKINDFKEHQTAIALTYKIVGQEQDTNSPVDDDGLSLWKEELEGIVAIGSNKIEYVTDSRDIALVLLNVPQISPGLLLAKLFLPPNYPNSFVGIHLVVNDKSFQLASYIKIAIVRKLYEFVLSSSFLGDCYLFSLIEWLESNIASIIHNPGSLVANFGLGNKRKIGNTTSSASTKRKKQVRVEKLLASDLEQIRKTYTETQNTPKLAQSIEQRKKLPAWNKREELVDVILNNKVTLITGETGSGKSTQIVQFVLDELSSQGNFESKIICTQPRRISTIGLAERISEERCQQTGEETGYIIRGENKTLKRTRLLFVTTGILLRMLQSFMSSSSSGSSLFDNLEFIFIDEVHERSVDSDFLINILKKIIGKLPKLKVVLMSATIDPTVFINYFPLVKVNSIHIKGRTFPIKDVYLDTILSELDFSMTTRDDQIIKPKADSQFFKSGRLNHDLIAQLCEYADGSLRSQANLGSILIFLPGVMEINECIRKIEERFRRNNSQVHCLPLHSALSSKDQKRVFGSAPKGARKIVVSTNIAETSVTIPDCVVVIDTGRAKSVYFDAQANTSRLTEGWCSRAEMTQRRGRSGRIQSGTCYHLYTEETQQSVLSQPIPEIRRTRLENLFLVVKAMGIKNVPEFLREGLDLPEEQSLEKAKSFLEEIGALDVEGNLSHLGKHLSLIPADLHVGKILILGCIFNCVEICVTIAAVCSGGSPYSNNFEIKDQVKRAKNNLSKGQGDLMASAFAFHQWENSYGGEKKKFVADNFLSFMTLQDIRSNRVQYLLTLKEIGFLPFNYVQHENDKLNLNSENYSILRAIITGSFTPNLARVQLPDPKYAQTLVGAIEIDPDAKQTKFWIRNEKYIEQVTSGSVINEMPATRGFIHPSSVLFSSQETGLTVNLEDLTLEDGSLDVQKARENFDLTPSAKLNVNSIHKAPIVVYTSANHTSKLFLRDITPTNVVSALLLGGKILYDIAGSISTGRSCPGIVLDLWMPIRTWCKNGVLLKKLRALLDLVIERKLSNPDNGTSDADDEEILRVITSILRSDFS